MSLDKIGKTILRSIFITDFKRLMKQKYEEKKIRWHLWVNFQVLFCWCASRLKVVVALNEVVTIDLSVTYYDVIECDWFTIIKELSFHPNQHVLSALKSSNRWCFVISCVLWFALSCVRWHLLFVIVCALFFYCHRHILFCCESWYTLTIVPRCTRYSVHLPDHVFNATVYCSCCCYCFFFTLISFLHLLSLSST